MLRFLSSFLIGLTLTSPALAACSGKDLRPSLSEAQNADLTELVATTPYPEGNYWIATKGDEIIHLIGTMHLSDPRMDAPLSRLQPVVEAAGVLLLEATDKDEIALQHMIASDPSMIMLQGKTLIDLMPEKDWERLSEAASSRGIPPFMAAKFQPWFLSLSLAIPPCMMAEFQSGSSGLDHKLNTLANAAGVPAKPLESFDTVFKIFAEDPVEEQIEMMSAWLIDDQANTDQLTTLFNTYFEEKVALGWHLSRIVAPSVTTLSPEKVEEVFDELEEELLIKRNRSWIPVILDAADSYEAPIVAAFGAAHLMGESGVLNLMAQQGFTLQRQPF